jgi:hypothetical protein
MIKLNDFLNITEYETGHLEVVHQEDVYGKTAISLEVYGFEFNKLICVYDIVSQEVLEIIAKDDAAGKSYVWQTSDIKGLGNYRDYLIELEAEEDILEKAEAIFFNKPYDSRIVVPIDIKDEDFLLYAKAAHKLDITINEFFEKAIQEMVEKYKG